MYNRISKQESTEESQKETEDRKERYGKGKIEVKRRGHTVALPYHVVKKH